MRIESVDVNTESEAFDLCPWAAVCYPTEGGYRCFESVADADIWLGQI